MGNRQRDFLVINSAKEEWSLHERVFSVTTNNTNPLNLLDPPPTLTRLYRHPYTDVPYGRQDIRTDVRMGVRKDFRTDPAVVRFGALKVPDAPPTPLFNRR